MYKTIARALFVGIVMFTVFGLTTSRLESKVVKGPPSGDGKGNSGGGLVIKTFQGILTGPGSVGTLQKLGYIDFRCDPKQIGWHIKVKGYSTTDNGAGTMFIGDPGVCDHVEVVMYYDPYGPTAPYYGKVATNEFDGIAISVRKIP